jgi:hypothetical protein
MPQSELVWPVLLINKNGDGRQETEEASERDNIPTLTEAVGTSRNDQIM